MATKYLVPLFFRHVFTGLALGSSRDKAFSYQKKIGLRCSLHIYLFNFGKNKNTIWKFHRVLYMYKGISWYFDILIFWFSTSKRILQAQNIRNYWISQNLIIVCLIENSKESFSFNGIVKICNASKHSLWRYPHEK